MAVQLGDMIIQFQILYLFYPSNTIISLQNQIISVCMCVCLCSTNS